MDKMKYCKLYCILYVKRIRYTAAYIPTKEEEHGKWRGYWYSGYEIPETGQIPPPSPTVLHSNGTQGNKLE